MSSRLCNDGSLGSGAGKGGGGGGSIRDAGGAFGKMQVAKEEEYFYKQVNFHFKTRLLKFRCCQWRSN